MDNSKLNPMCINCLCLNHTCEGTKNQTWTGCVNKKVGKEYEDTIQLILSFSDISDMAAALQNRMDTMITLGAPGNMLVKTLERAKRLNNILRAFEFNHDTDRVFEKYEKYIKENTYR